MSARAELLAKIFTRLALVTSPTLGCKDNGKARIMPGIAARDRLVTTNRIIATIVLMRATLSRIHRSSNRTM